MTRRTIADEFAIFHTRCTAGKVKIPRSLFWLAALIALTMAALPHPPQLPGSPSDKFQHILAFAVLAGLAGIGFQKVSALRLWLLLSAFGALIEVVQMIPALHRDSDLLDWLADTLAAGLVLVSFRAARRFTS